MEAHPAGGLAVRLRHVGCRHGRLEAVRGVDPEVRAGERIALTGTDGSGRTTLLRAVLGLHRQADGEIVVGGGAAAAPPSGWAWAP
ncbi:ATP-binding cassette domain-containing protein [Streptomyces lydicus]|uniref:ATP-binding cassette domain-containing protein n=1 Tax=Streptomyces lydicus TaxID=47763 RepID=UPI0035BEA2ED